MGHLDLNGPSLDRLSSEFYIKLFLVKYFSIKNGFLILPFNFKNTTDQDSIAKD